MPKEIPPFDLNYLVAAQNEMRVRQATQQTTLRSLMLPGPHDARWEPEMEDEHASEGLPDQEQATVWEITLELL